MKTLTRIQVMVAWLFPLVASACSGGAPAATPTEIPLSIWQYEKVCRQGVLPEAAVYDGSAGKVHPIVLFDRDGTHTNDYSSMTNTLLKLPETWMVDYEEDPAMVELVICITRVHEEFVKTCEFEDDEDPELEYLLDLYDADYEVRVITALDGKEIGGTTLEARGDTCPMFHMFSEEEEESFAGLNGADLQAFLEKYVQP